MTASNTLLRAWERIQVELQGRYTLTRLREVVEDITTSSWVSRALWIVLTPLPALFILILVDSAPLRSASLGFEQQTPWVFVRIYVLGVFGSIVVLHQVVQAVPSLTLTPWQFAFIAALTPLVGTIPVVLLGKFWVFPVPFTLQFTFGPWACTASLLLWRTWRDVLESDVKSRAKLNCYLKVLSVHGSIVSMYVAYYIAFTPVGDPYQLYVAMLLPVVKLFCKNRIRSGLIYLEDLVPCVVVTNVDVFHSIFVSTTLHQAQGQSTVAFIMFIDVLQTLMAFYELFRASHYGNSTTTASSEDRGSSGSSSSLVGPKNGVVEYALFLVNTQASIRDHPSIALPQYIKEQHASLRDADSYEFLTFVRSRRARIRPGPRLSVPTLEQASTMNAVPIVSPSVETKKVDLYCVQSVLRMLHMVEFYVLIEFVEAAVASVCTLYAFTLTYLPNRSYYVQFGSRSTAELHKATSSLATYASLEMLSLVLFCVIVNRIIRPVSTTQQLAFVLRKHWSIFMSTTAWWIFMVSQFSLEHLGMDFTFRFEWMRKHQAPQS